MGRKWEINYEHISKKYGTIKILNYINYKNCTIQFEDETILTNINYGNLKKDLVKNNNTPIVYGLGFIGYGKYIVKFNKLKYDTWIAMLKRAYSNVYPTYKDVSVCVEWYNFQNFAKWHEDNYNYEMMQGWHLDKDILVKGNKIYSPETCCFVPSKINSLFIKSNLSRGKCPIGVSYNKLNKNYTSNIYLYNKIKHVGSYSTTEEAFQAYKIEKEKHIKEVADEWKDKISSEVYQAMYNYQVEITD